MAAETEGQTILVVEDNALNRRLFADVLSGAGYAVVVAGDGAAAVDRARDSRPDLILMDLELPRVSGLEAVRRLRSDPDLPRLPIVAVSAFVSEADRRSACANGCDGYLPKPVRPADLVATVRAILDRPVAMNGD